VPTFTYTPETQVSVKETKEMKRFFVCSVVMLFILSFSHANATLLGVDLTGLYPDIYFNTLGRVQYDADTGLFKFTAIDKTITHDPSTEEYLSFTGFGLDLLTTFEIQLYVDSNGDLDLSKPRWMVEKVETGPIFVKEHEYGSGTTILRGDVKEFGWKPVAPGEKPQFDFLIDNVSGTLVDDGIWNTTYDTGITSASGNTWPTGLNWDTSFDHTKVEGHKAPLKDPFVAPEPGTLLLLGSSLIGLAAYVKIRQNKKKI